MILFFLIYYLALFISYFLCSILIYSANFFNLPYPLLHYVHYSFLLFSSITSDPNCIVLPQAYDFVTFLFYLSPELISLAIYVTHHYILPYLTTNHWFTIIWNVNEADVRDLFKNQKLKGQLFNFPQRICLVFEYEKRHV